MSAPLMAVHRPRMAQKLILLFLHIHPIIVTENSTKAWSMELDHSDWFLMTRGVVGTLNLALVEIQILRAAQSHLANWTLTTVK